MTRRMLTAATAAALIASGLLRPVDESDISNDTSTPEPKSDEDTSSPPPPQDVKETRQQRRARERQEAKARKKRLFYSATEPSKGKTYGKS